MENFKDILGSEFEKWASKAKKNNGKTVIDISTEFQEIMARNIIQITLGEDINDELLDYNVKDNNGEFIPKKVKLSEAIKESLD